MLNLVTPLLSPPILFTRSNGSFIKLFQGTLWRGPPFPAISGSHPSLPFSTEVEPLPGPEPHFSGLPSRTSFSCCFLKCRVQGGPEGAPCVTQEAPATCIGGTHAGWCLRTTASLPHRTGPLGGDPVVSEHCGRRRCRWWGVARCLYSLAGWP